MALSVGIEPTTQPPEGHVISISPREHICAATPTRDISALASAIIKRSLNKYQ